MGSNLVFVAVSAALFFYPGWEAALFPLYGLIFLWADWREEEEAHVIFVFLASAAGVLLIARAPSVFTRVGLALEMAALWGLSFGLSFHRTRLTKQRRGVLTALDKLDLEIRDSDRELSFYNKFEGTAVAQLVLRRDLVQAAKSLGTTMDAKEVQVRLLRILEGRYKSSRVKIIPGTPHDPLLDWASRTHTPVLVKDMTHEDRFGPRRDDHAFRSALVVPLNVRKNPYGFVRLEADEPGVYGSDDLRTVDLYATLASLTLENIQLYHEVHSLATHDALTQLKTQRAFRMRLNEELLRAHRAQTPMALILCDIDHFKRYNDSYGHQAGDELLRTVARLLSKYARPVDCVARYGGEEFAILLPNIVHGQAIELAQNIRQAVEAEPFVFQGKQTNVTMSFGVASFPKDATSDSQIIRAADERLYRSKDGGRNQVTG